MLSSNTIILNSLHLYFPNVYSNVVKHRAQEPEIIDLGAGYYTIEEYHHCLDQLSQIGRFLGGDRATFKALRRMQPQSVLDIGCGGGGFTQRLARVFNKAKVVGIDLSASAIDYAKKQQSDNLEFRVVEGLPFEENSFDLVTSTLVCHHIPDEELVPFLVQVYRIAKEGVVINDLHRHRMAVGAFYLASRLFFRNRLVKHDGILSIKKSFRRKDWIGYLERAKIPLEKCSIKRRFPFRWIVQMRK